MLALTSRQQKIYTLVRQFLDSHGYPPTLQELADKLKIQPSAVRMHLLLMQKKHALRYIPHISRGIELLQRSVSGIPIYGSAPAGHPFWSQENVLDSFEIRKYLTSSSEIFGIYVRGDSMKGALLSSGDLLFVDPKREPRNGDIVVASVVGEPTIKRFYKEDGVIKLRAENKKYSPIIVEKADENFKIYGTVVGMIRALDKKRIDALVGEYKTFAQAS